MLRRKFRNDKPNKVLAKHNTGFVLDNYVEAEVKTALWPLHVAQWLTLAPKYSIRYDFVTSNGHKFNTSVCLCAVGIAATWFYCTFDFLCKSGGLLSATLFAYSITLISVYIFNSTITASKSNMNAYLIVLIQRIERDFQCVKLNSRNVTIFNWVYIIVDVAFNVLHFTIRIVEVPRAAVRVLLVHLIYISNDCNAIIEFRTLHLLGKQIDTWILELEHYCHTNSFHDSETDFVKKIETGIKQLITTHDKIIEALNICNQTFGPPILLTLVMTVFQAYFNVQYVILLPSWSQTLYISQTLWIKNITLLIILCMECENVSLKLKNAEVACIVLSAAQRTPELSWLLRRLGRRAGGGDGAWLRAAGLFPVDAALPPRVLAVLATYTVVLLQFHFL